MAVFHTKPPRWRDVDLGHRLQGNQLSGTHILLTLKFQEAVGLIRNVVNDLAKGGVVEGGGNPGGVYSAHGIVGVVCRVTLYSTLHGDTTIEHVRDE